MTLYENWRTIAFRAWSSRFIALAFVATMFEVGWPLMDGYVDVPRGVFAALSALFAALAFVARLVAQNALLIQSKDHDQ